MINYVEKGNGLQIAIGVNGYSLGSNNTRAFDTSGKESPEIDVAVQAIIDSYDPLPEARLEAIAAINKRANELIIADMPISKQLNSMREIVKLKGNGSPSAAEQSAITALEGLFTYTDLVRAQSDIDVININAQTDWTLCVPDFTAMEAIV